MSKIASSAGSIFSFLIAGAAGVSPEDAQSNLAAWAKLLGSEDMERFFTPTVNRTVFWAGISHVCCVFVYVVSSTDKA